MPEWRVFEAEVPEPVEVSPEQREVWAQGASWLERDYAAGNPEADAGVEVSAALSRSIGEPEEVEEDWEEIVVGLEAELRREREERKRLREFLERHGGKAVEGTGWNVIGFTGSYWFWLVVVVGILAVGGGPLLLMAFRGMRRTVETVVGAIDLFEDERPGEAAVLKREYLSRKLDRAQKREIRKAKARLR